MKPCDACPWRAKNQGTRHPHGFYTLRNLRRLWNGLRDGNSMSCHPTDPRHPDHGAKPDSKPQECAGAHILIRRELRKMSDEKGVIGDVGLLRYLKDNPKGLTKRGIFYWCVERIVLAGKPILGDLPLLDVDDTDPEVILPEKLA